MVRNLWPGRAAGRSRHQVVDRACCGAKLALGAILIALGLLILSGFDKKVEAVAVDLSPVWLTSLTTRF